MQSKFTHDLIAPCGMNCGICKSYLAFSRGTPSEKGKVSHCSGCRLRNKNCAFLKKDCRKIGKKEFEFCFECENMPCSNLDRLDKKYRERYGMSMVENLRDMKEKGIASFLVEQENKYRCPQCGDVVSVHNLKCYSCGKTVE